MDTLKVNVEDMYCRKKKLALNVEYLRRQEIHCSSARYKCPIKNIRLELTTKSQIETRRLEPLLMLAHC